MFLSTLSLSVYRFYIRKGYEDLLIISQNLTESVTPPSRQIVLSIFYCPSSTILSKQALITSVPSEQPEMLISWVGNSTSSSWARYLPISLDIYMAWVKGLFQNFYFRPSLMVMMLRQEPAMNLARLAMVSLCHSRAQISWSGMMSVRAFHWVFLSMSSDRNPLIQMLTTFLRGSAGSDKLTSLKMGLGQSYRLMLVLEGGRKLARLWQSFSTSSNDLKSMLSSGCRCLISRRWLSNHRRHSMVSLNLSDTSMRKIVLRVLLRNGSQSAARHWQMCTSTTIHDCTSGNFPGVPDSPVVSNY